MCVASMEQININPSIKIMKSLALIICATAALLTMPACVSADREVTSSEPSASTRSSTSVSTDMPYSQRSSRTTTVSSY